MKNMKFDFIYCLVTLNFEFCPSTEMTVQKKTMFVVIFVGATKVSAISCCGETEFPRWLQSVEKRINFQCIYALIDKLIHEWKNGLLSVDV